MKQTQNGKLESILMAQVLELEKALRILDARVIGTTAEDEGTVRFRRPPLVLETPDDDDAAEQRFLDRIAAIRLATRALTDGASLEPATDAVRRSVQRLPDTDPFATLLKDVAAHRSAEA